MLCQMPMPVKIAVPTLMTCSVFITQSGTSALIFTSGSVAVGPPTSTVAQPSRTTPLQVVFSVLRANIFPLTWTVALPCARRSAPWRKQSMESSPARAARRAARPRNVLLEPVVIGPCAPPDLRSPIDLPTSATLVPEPMMPAMATAPRGPVVTRRATPRPIARPAARPATSPVQAAVWPI
jgi:hypothetical protein